MKALLVIALSLIALPAFAGTATVTWTNPTSYSDASALVPADIASSTVEYGTCNGAAFGTKAGQVVTAGAATSAVVNNLTPGAWCFRVSTTVTAAKGGQTSDFSAVATKSVAFPKPNPPSIIDVIIAFIKRLFGHFA
jgi:hypothetical protein